VRTALCLVHIPRHDEPIDQFFHARRDAVQGVLLVDRRLGGGGELGDVGKSVRAAGAAKLVNQSSQRIHVVLIEEMLDLSNLDRQAFNEFGQHSANRRLMEKLAANRVGGGAGPADRARSLPAGRARQGRVDLFEFPSAE